MSKIFGFEYSNLRFNQNIVNIKWIGKAAKTIEEKISTEIYSYFPSEAIKRKESFSFE